MPGRTAPCVSELGWRGPVRRRGQDCLALRSRSQLGLHVEYEVRRELMGSSRKDNLPCVSRSGGPLRLLWTW